MAKKRRKKGLSQAERDRRARQAGQVAPGIPHVELFHFGEGSKIRGTIKNVKAKIRGATGGIASADKDADIDIDWENIEHDVSTQDSTQLSEEPDDSARGRETDGQAS